MAKADQRNQTKTDEDRRDPHAAVRRVLPWMIGINVGLILTALLLRHWLLAFLAAVVVALFISFHWTLNRARPWHPRASRPCPRTQGPPGTIPIWLPGGPMTSLKGTPSRRYQVLKEPEVKRVLLVGTVVVSVVSVGSALGSAFGRNPGHHHVLPAALVMLGVAVLYPLGMAAMYLFADRVAQSGRVRTEWSRAPTARQWAVGIPAILVGAAIVGGALLLLLS